MINLMNNINSFKKEILEDECKNASERRTNLITFSKNYCNFFEKKMKELDNYEQNLTENCEKKMNSVIGKIINKTNNLNTKISSNIYNNTKSNDIISGLEKLLEEYQNFFTNCTELLEGIKTYKSFLASKKFINNEDDENIEYKQDKQAALFAYELNHNVDEYTLNYLNDNKNNEIKSIIYNGTKIDNNISSDILLTLVKGFKKIINSYDEAVDRENEIINNAKIILKEYADKINGLSSEYEKFIENVKKDYTSLVEKDITENEYIEERALENIKKYLGILSDSTDDYLKIRLFLPTLTNEQIEQYKKDKKNKEINDLINCLKDFLDNIKGTGYKNEITVEEINKTEKELEPEKLTYISFNKKEDGVTEESINFFTNKKSVYYNGTEYINDENDADIDKKLCSNIKRNQYSFISYLKNINYDDLEAQVQEIRENGRSLASFFRKEGYEKNKELFKKINDYYKNYAETANKILNETVDTKKAEYEAADDVEKNKIVEAIKRKMNRYLLTNMERLNEYLESINLAWCQEDKIIEEIKKRIKING